MSYTIHEGDALELLQTISAQSIDCVITGPPYYGFRRASDDDRAIGYEKSHGEYFARLADVFSECRRVMRQDASCWVVMIDGETAAQFVSAVAEVGLVFAGIKELARGERLVLLNRSDSGERYSIPGSDINDPITRIATMSPEVVRFCIENGCPESGAVLDFFCGTGMTLAVAVSMGRNAIGIEIAPSQIALIEKRMAYEPGQELGRL